MGNVLLAYNPEGYVQKIIQDPDAGKNVLKELFYGPEWEQLDADDITEEQIVRQVQRRIPQYADSVKLAMDLWHSDLTPVAGMADIIGRLKEKGYKIYLLSNTSLRFLKFYKKVELFQEFDGFLISAKEKLMKPDPAIYRRLCERYGLIPQECLFIDDLQKNIDGAIHAGWKGHRFTGAKELNEFFKSRDIL